ncbi:MAG: efflux RND transporter periplasmic adaptor subunit [Pseudomonadales bacterium]|nr:efflux RND transporter periplasmic adaptor subunit [Pseudomonadales bacterium]MBO6563431.1 efflux RND transporter periplasmic adaptor subunit [Pseudomonadales bacterium]MBO6595746.1 efflux RND transporter periplasmic adaptor subunit [Pseudomonadales bacterium]MBO6820696.1 efflux RND transporter periplasmic adaptor subunit [Pseudomonadales bacterium]
MRATYITAIIIAVLVSLWLLSGQFGEQPEPPASNIAEQNRRVNLLQEEKPLTKVRVATIHSSEQERILSVRGRTQNKRSVIVQSQISGIVVDRPIERGDRVEKGDLLCKISVEDREVGFSEARTAVEQAKIEFEGSQKLSKQGLQSETAIAQTRARLAAAEAILERRRLDIARLEIRAPFPGVVEEHHMEVGQFVTPGSDCVTLVDLDPMLFVGNVTETELPFLTPGLQATARLATGHIIGGKLSFVAKTADEGTRTYRIEVEFENKEYKIPSGLTAQIGIPVESVRAQKISPALLVLDDEGVLGVRTVDSNNIVQIHPVEIVADELDGIWVTGLPDVAQLIVVGQQLVVAGETVDPTHSDLSIVSTGESEGATL